VWRKEGEGVWGLLTEYCCGVALPLHVSLFSICECTRMVCVCIRSMRLFHLGQWFKGGIVTHCNGTLYSKLHCDTPEA